MEPSRELDALVAKNVMNWPSMHPLSRPVPLYSTDISAAWQVDKSGWLWKFQEAEQALTVTLYTSFEVLQKVIRYYPVVPKETVLIRQEWLPEGKARTYAWLRCLAALEAVDVEVKNEIGQGT